MELQEEHKDRVRAWAAEGCGLSEIQRRLAEECGIKLTFMDVRFLVLDLGVEIKDKTSTEKKDTSLDDTTAAEQGVGSLDEDKVLGDGVRVEIDRVMKPGALVSGSAIFSDGVEATWMLDQMGRLSLIGPTPEYRPGPEDIQSFQQALQQELSKRGYA